MKENQKEIREKNRVILQRLSVLYTVILIGYAIMAYFTFRTPALNRLYLLVLIAQLVFDGYVFLTTRRYASFARVQRLCMLFCVLVMAFIITVSVYPFPEKPAIYFPTILIALAVLFIFSWIQLVLMQAGFVILFLFIAYFLKTPEAYMYDAFASVAAFLVGLICVYIVVELRLKENDVKNRLQVLCATDRLTGISNKSAAEKLVRQYLREKAKDAKCILLMIDLDNFKQINDREGHVTGDNVLRLVGKCLRSCCRESDIVGRIGGDEFLIFIKDISERKVAERRASDVLEMIRNTDFGLGRDSICCSIGIAICDGQSLDFQNLMQSADKAMYQAKLRGKNTFAVWQDQA